MSIITRKLEFDAGHRVLGHEGKCKHLHGHRYVAEITIASPQLDSLGRVIDFGVVKEVIGGWIDQHWDHNLLLCQEDPLNQFHKSMWPAADVGVAQFRKDIFAGKDPYIMELGNPTAENIAAELLTKSIELLRDKPELRVENVRIYETPNCWADCNPSILQMMVDTKNVESELEKPIQTAEMVTEQFVEDTQTPIVPRAELAKQGLLDTKIGHRPISRVLPGRGRIELQRVDFDPRKTEFGVPHERLEEQMKILSDWAAKVPLGSSIDLVGDGYLFGKYVTSEKGIEYIPHK